MFGHCLVDGDLFESYKSTDIQTRLTLFRNIMIQRLKICIGLTQRIRLHGTKQLKVEECASIEVKNLVLAEANGSMLQMACDYMPPTTAQWPRVYHSVVDVLCVVGHMFYD